MNIQEEIKKYKIIFENYLNDILKNLPSGELSETIKYSIRNGGKRLRPILMLITSDCFGVDLKKALPLACALELVHCSSLVHDDLPCIDNDDFRRGQLSCHKKFGEAEGVLCGDAMLNFAYEVVLNSFEDINQIKALKLLADYSGVNGMLGGQFLDVTCEKRNISSKEILYNIQLNKTSKLLTAPLVMASVLANELHFENLKSFGTNLGIAFQIADDILDVVGSQQNLGKSIGKDEQNGKLTSVSLYGLAQAKKMVVEYTTKAIDAIKDIKELNILSVFAKFLIDRDK